MLPGVPTGGFERVFSNQQLFDGVVQMHVRNGNVFYLLAWLGYPELNGPCIRLQR